MIKDLLLGKPIRHPLHPALVHLPIGLFFLSLIFDLLSYARTDGQHLVLAAYYTMLFGIITAVIAAVPGLIDWADIRADHPASRIATWHMLLNLLAVGLYGINIGLRWNGFAEPSTPAAPLALSLIAIGILSFSGYLGGRLVYEDGVGVGRHRRERDAPPATFKAGTEEDAGRFVPVADADCLPVGQAIRAEVNGHVMAIVNVSGELHAFQDFCTHRFAPLSEGEVREDGQVQCPWHRSCFDVRTGKVTHGPAKVDLRMYEVQVEQGKVQVKVPGGKSE